MCMAQSRYPFILQQMEHILGQQYTIFRRVAPYTPTRSCVRIGVLKTKIKSKKKEKIRNNKNLKKSGKQSLVVAFCENSMS